MYKEITVDYERLFYEIDEYECGEYGMTCKNTIFHILDGFGERREYYLFGCKIRYAKFKEVFTLDFNIENPEYSKQEVGDAIRKELKLLNRKREIERGEII